MTYQFAIQVKPCVNFHTHAAEVSATDHTYDGSSKGIIVRQKHIQSCPDNDLAEQVAEEFCTKLHEKLKALVIEELSRLRNALP